MPEDPYAALEAKYRVAPAKDPYSALEAKYALNPPGPTVKNLQLKLTEGGAADLTGLPIDQVIKALGEDPEVIMRSKLFQKKPDLLLALNPNKGTEAVKGSGLMGTTAARFGQRFLEMGEAVAQKGLFAGKELGLISPEDQRYLDLVMRAQRNQSRLATGQTGYGLPEVAADVLTPLPGGKLKAASAAGRLGLGAARGVVGALSTPVDVRGAGGETNLVSNIVDQLAGGAGFGALTQGAGEGAARLMGRGVAVQRGYNELAQEAQNAGKQPGFVRRRLMDLLGSSKTEDVQSLLPPQVSGIDTADRLAADLQSAERKATNASTRRYNEVKEMVGVGKSPMYATREWLDASKAAPGFARNERVQKMVQDLEDSFYPSRGNTGKMQPAKIKAQFETLQTEINDMFDKAQAAKYSAEPDRKLARLYTDGARAMRQDLMSLAEKHGAKDMLVEANAKWASEVKPFLKHPELRSMLAAAANPGDRGKFTSEIADKWVSAKPQRLGGIVEKLSPEGQRAFQQHLVGSVYQVKDVLDEAGRINPQAFLREIGRREAAYDLVFKGKARDQMEGLKLLLSEASRVGATLGVGGVVAGGAAIGSTGGVGGAALGAGAGAIGGAKSTGKWSPMELGRSYMAKLFTDPKYSRVLQAANIYKPGSPGMAKLFAEFARLAGAESGAHSGRDSVVSPEENP